MRVVAQQLHGTRAVLAAGQCLGGEPADQQAKQRREQFPGVKAFASPVPAAPRRTVSHGQRAAAGDSQLPNDGGLEAPRLREAFRGTRSNRSSVVSPWSSSVFVDVFFSYTNQVAQGGPVDQLLVGDPHRVG